MTAPLPNVLLQKIASCVAAVSSGGADIDALTELSGGFNPPGMIHETNAGPLNLAAYVSFLDPANWTDDPTSDAPQLFALSGLGAAQMTLPNRVRNLQAVALVGNCLLVSGGTKGFVCSIMRTLNQEVGSPAQNPLWPTVLVGSFGQVIAALLAQSYPPVAVPKATVTKTTPAATFTVAAPNRAINYAFTLNGNANVVQLPSHS